MSHINSWEPCYFTEVPEGRQTYALDVLWLQKGAQIRMSEWSQSFTFTKNTGQGFIPCSTPPTQWTDSPIRRRCLLRVLCPIRRPITALDCVLLKDRNLALAPSQGPKINSRACFWVSPRPCHHTQCWLTNLCLIFLLPSCLDSPRLAQVQQTLQQSHLLRACLQTHSLVPQHVQGPQYSPTTCQAELHYTGVDCTTFCPLLLTHTSSCDHIHTTYTTTESKEREGTQTINTQICNHKS